VAQISPTPETAPRLFIIQTILSLGRGLTGYKSVNAIIDVLEKLGSSER
jgi:hypothetical protein